MSCWRFFQYTHYNFFLLLFYLLILFFFFLQSHATISLGRGDTKETIIINYHPSYSVDVVDWTDRHSARV
jgi:hypothetical protein